MIAGDRNRFAIECELAEQTDRWLLGRFRFWLCGVPVGNWEDQADLRGCVRWLLEFANVPRNRFEPSLASADAEEVFRRVYDPVIGLDGAGASVENAYARFHISHLGMSSFDQCDLLLVVDESGGERCLWRQAGSVSIQECRLRPQEMARVAKAFCAAFDREHGAVVGEVCQIAPKPKEQSVCIQDLLILGLDDRIQVADVASVTLTTGGGRSPKECREFSLELIRWLLDEGLAEAGEVTDGVGFVPWEVSVPEAVARIEREWVGTGPGLGEIGWLNLTEKGQAEAEALWAEQSGPG